MRKLAALQQTNAQLTSYKVNQLTTPNPRTERDSDSTQTSVETDGAQPVTGSLAAKPRAGRNTKRVQVSVPVEGSSAAAVTMRRPATGNQIKSEREPESMETAQLHLDLNRLSTMDCDEDDARREFRELIQKYTSAVGVGHVIQDDDGNWDLKPNHATGRVPRRHDFVERFARCCELTIDRNSIQIESFLGLESFYTPIQVFGAADEVLLVLSGDRSSARTLYVLEIVANYFSLWLKNRRSKRSDWKLSSLAALIELVSAIEKQPSVQDGCQVIASELGRHLNCEHAAVATNFRGRMRVQAVSGTEKIEQSSRLLSVLQTALSETLLRDEMCRWPAVEEEESQLLLLGHRQLARDLGAEAVSSISLISPDGEKVGAFIVAGQSALLQGDRLPNFMRTAAPRLASALDVVYRAERSRIVRLVQLAVQKLRTVRGRMWVLICLGVIAAMMLPVPYRVRTNCVVESTQRRFVVAPFDGVIAEGFVEPGDQVKQGELLARMDDQQIRYELASVIAEKQQAIKQREINLAERDVSSSLLSDLETQRLKAKQELLEHQQRQVEMRKIGRAHV